MEHALGRDGNDVLVSAKVLQVEREEIANLVNVHRCNESSVMNLNTRYPFGDDNSSPLPMGSFTIGDEVKPGFNKTCTFICFGNGKAETPGSVMLPVDHLAREVLCAKLGDIWSFTSERIQEAPEFLLARPGAALWNGVNRIQK